MDDLIPEDSDAPVLSMVVLGCDGSWPGPGGAASGYLIRSDATCLLVDVGPGTFANLQQVADPASVDAVVISHHHPDHWTDLYGVATHAQVISGRTDIPVLAPHGMASRAHLEDSRALEWRTVTDGDRIEVGDMTCGFRRTEHRGETLAVRIDCRGRSQGDCTIAGSGCAMGDLGSAS